MPQLLCPRRILALAASLLITSAAWSQTTWYVDDDAPNDPGAGSTAVSDPNEDGSAAHPFDAIAEAVNLAVTGDTVIVRDGTYTGAGNKQIDFDGRLITVRSENGPATTIIDLEDDGRAFFFESGESDDARVAGFTIINGNVVWNSPGSGRGAGVYCYWAGPTIDNCIFHDNYAEQDGAALFCDWAATPTITNCYAYDNQAGSYGGGFCAYNESNATLINCDFVSNSGIAGTGITAFGSNLTLIECSVVDNASIGGL